MAKWQSGKAARQGRHGTGGRRGFSLIEMLVALAITASLLSASLAALDTSFKSYQMTSQSSSTHVVTRIVMHRMLSMIRVGTEFGPFPADVFDPALNPIVMEVTQGDPTYIEFVSHYDAVSGDREVTRLVVQPSGDGTYELTIQIATFPGGGGSPTIPAPTPLLRNLRSATFTLEYDVGPKLRKASIDLTVAPSDIGDDIDIGLTAPVIRLVASASPRNLE